MKVEAKQITGLTGKLGRQAKSSNFIYGMGPIILFLISQFESTDYQTIVLDILMLVIGFLFLISRPYFCTEKKLKQSKTSYPIKMNRKDDERFSLLSFKRSLSTSSGVLYD
jgi:hypothetical protein